MKIFVLGGSVAARGVRPDNDERSIIEKTFATLAIGLTKAGHDLVVCSPYRDSVDYYAVVGAASVPKSELNSQPHVEFHYPDTPGVDSEIRKLITELNLDRVRFFSHLSPSDTDSEEAVRYAWLLAQINALDTCHLVVTLGGRLDGAASLLVRIAEAHRKPILPLRFIGGAAARVYDRLQYELQDKLGEDLPVLNDPSRIAELGSLVEKLGMSSLDSPDTNGNMEFFISYPRSRPEEADFIETLLRRRNFTVYRDEEDFEAGAKTYEEIRQHIYRSNVFVAIWCKEYACSPWCFDELDLALDRKEAGKMSVWMLRVDDTRIVPPRARNILYLDGRNRSEIEARMLHVIVQTLQPSKGD